MKAMKIAIVDGNALSLLGMKTLLERVVPQMEVVALSNFQQIASAGECVHFFVSAQIVLEHIAYFRQRRHLVIVMVNGLGQMPQMGDFHVLNVACTEETLVANVMALMQHAHQRGRNLPQRPQWDEPNGLTPREVEVLKLLVRGMINKEIADRLNISMTTVISHRKSIQEKLRLRSVAELTLYAVMNGYLEL